MAEKETLPLAALESLIREELSSGGSAVINIRGVSMLPLLKEGVTSVRIVGGLLACTAVCRFWGRLLLGKGKRVLGGKK
ncbi:MAG: hypothetical protein IKT91_06890 [Clostridia bacterium]|nr:hypothetical protein [Clostridia bacterium]